MNNTEAAFLAQTIEDTPLSVPIKAACEEKKIQTLESLTNLTVDQMMALPGVGVHGMLEIYKYLKKHGYGYIIEKKR